MNKKFLNWVIIKIRQQTLLDASKSMNETKATILNMRNKS
jgi:hypothetical protein